MILHRLHIMPYTMFFGGNTGKCFSHIERPFSTFMCIAEQLVITLQVLQRPCLQVKVPASENIGSWGSEAHTEWLLRLCSHLYDVTGNKLKMSLVSWSVISVL